MFLWHVHAGLPGCMCLMHVWCRPVPPTCPSTCMCRGYMCAHVAVHGGGIYPVCACPVLHVHVVHSPCTFLCVSHMHTPHVSSLLHMPCMYPPLCMSHPCLTCPTFIQRACPPCVLCHTHAPHVAHSLHMLYKLVLPCTHPLCMSCTPHICTGGGHGTHVPHMYPSLSYMHVPHVYHLSHRCTPHVPPSLHITHV